MRIPGFIRYFSPSLLEPLPSVVCVFLALRSTANLLLPEGEGEGEGEGLGCLPVSVGVVRLLESYCVGLIGRSAEVPSWTSGELRSSPPRVA